MLTTTSNLLVDREYVNLYGHVQILVHSRTVISSSVVLGMYFSYLLQVEILM